MNATNLIERPADEESAAVDGGDDIAATAVDMVVDAPNEYATDPAAAPPVWRTDTLAQSLAVLIVLSVVQRLIGFVRQILVCRWLEPGELGQWDIAFKFLMLAAPVTVLGLPGSFGRYMEHYRRRGHLKTMLRRTAAACIALSCLAAIGLVGFRGWVAELIYGSASQADMVVLLAGALLTVIAYNFLTEMLTALRMVRVASIVQLFNAIAFAALSVVFVFGWRCDAAAVVVAYALSSLLLVVPTLFWFRRTWRAIPEHREPLSHGGLWAKLAPFAMSVWVVNLLYNLVGVVDRYMMIHFARTDDPLVLVGHYHSAQVVPMLMVSVTGLLGGVLLPYLSHDWEMGGRGLVANKLNLTIKLLSLLMFVGSTVVLLASPLLFGVLLHGKYDGGEEILPWTLIYCAWMALIPVAQMYLWCAERARLPCLALVAGLIVNVVLCLLLLPHYGLHGVVWATAAANLVSLAAIYRFNQYFGMRIDLGTWLITLLPILLGAGPVVAVVAVAAVGLEAVIGQRLFSSDEKHQIATAYRHYVVERFMGKPVE